MNLRRHLLYPIFGLSLIAASSLAFAQTAESEFALLIQDTQKKIDASLERYEAFLKSNQNEKLKLIASINDLEGEIVQLRASETRARRANAENRSDLSNLKERIKTFDTQSQYALGVLSEYLTNFESRIQIAEDQAYQAPLSEIRKTLESASDNPTERFPPLFESLNLGLERQTKITGGYRFEGRAITPTGGVKNGTVALIGPVSYFAASDGSATGPLRFNSGTIEPGLIPMSLEQGSSIQSLLTKGSGILPLDASLGNAYELKKAKGTLLEHIAKGGWVGYAILLLGAFAILVALYKFIELRTETVQEPGDLRSIAQTAIKDSIDAAKRKIESLKGPMASMLKAGIDFSMTDSDTLIDSMDATILRYRPKLERFLPLLATTAAVAPLMGLLGTVVGMIKTFTLIEVFGTGDAKSLSSGISEALVTTELGLIVAIPALVFHGVFTRIMRSRIGTLERVATDFTRYTIALRQKEKPDA